MTFTLERTKSITKALCTVSLLAVIISSIVCYKASLVSIGLFIFFIAFFIVLPGDYLLQRCEIKSHYLSSRIARAFFAGEAFLVLLYYLSALIHFHRLLFLLCPLLSVMWITELRKTGFTSIPKKIRAFLTAIPGGAAFFFLLAFLYSMCATQYQYIDPEYSLFSLMKQDFGFHAGIINALADSYPPLNPWIDGRIITYHYYSEMILSVALRLLGITSDHLLMICTPYYIAPIFSLSLYAFFKEMSSKKERAAYYCLAFHFSNMFMLKQFSYSWFLYHTYSNVNNSGIGLSCFLVAIPLIKEFDNSDLSRRKHPSKAIIGFWGILIMLMTGMKGPVALVLVCGMIGSCILSIILKQSNRYMLYATGLALICFMLIYIYVLGGEHSNASGGAVLNFAEVTDLFFLKQPIIKALGSMGLPRFASLIVVFIVFIVFYLTAFLIPFTAGYITEFLAVVGKKKKFQFSRVSVYACFAVGFISLMLLNFSGHSQVYFGFAASVLVPLIAFWFLEDFESRGNGLIKIIRASYVVMLCLFICTMCMYVQKSYLSLKSYYNSKGIHLEEYRNVSKLEYEGLIWLKENTEKNVLCASDRFNSVSMKNYDYTRRNNNTHFAYAIYSQRRQYLEGSGFSFEPSDNDLRKEMLKKNSLLFDVNNANRGNDARSLGVSYVIVSKRFNDVGDLSNYDYSLCYSNDELDIYEVTNVPSP